MPRKPPAPMSEREYQAWRGVLRVIDQILVTADIPGVKRNPQTSADVKAWTSLQTTVLGKVTREQARRMAAGEERE